MHYNPGKDNVFTNTCSHLDYCKEYFFSNGDQFLSSVILWPKEWTLLIILFDGVFLHLPLLSVHDNNQGDYQWISTKLNNTNELLTCKQKIHVCCFKKVLCDKEIICYLSPQDVKEMQWKIVLTDSMIWPTLH